MTTSKLSEPSASAYYAMLRVIKEIESTLSTMKKWRNDQELNEIRLVHPCDIDELIHHFDHTTKALQGIRSSDSTSYDGNRMHVNKQKL